MANSVKTCTICGEMKPLEAFHRSVKSRDGRVSRCKACRNEVERVRLAARRREREPRPGKTTA